MVASRVNNRDLSSYTGQIDNKFRAMVNAQVRIYTHLSVYAHRGDTSALRKKADTYHLTYEIAKQNLIISFMQIVITINTLSTTIIRGRDDYKAH